jgi:hypothetical protein
MKLLGFSFGKSPQSFREGKLISVKEKLQTLYTLGLVADAIPSS